jgi:membrane-associated phospholipid phosphatase
MDFWFAVTQLGLPEAWASIALGMVITYLILRHTLWKKDSRERRAFKSVTLLLVLGLGLTFVLVEAVKESARVPRPCVPCTGSPEEISCNPYCVDGDYSFPSGHAATGFCVATVFFILWRRRSGLAVFLAAALIAFSRVALGVHTFQDILAGGAIGIAAPLVVWRIRPRKGILS